MMRIKLFCFVPFILFLGCNAGPGGTHEASHTDSEHAQTETYTCPMHPQVMLNHAGTCPVCGMDLVKVARHADSVNSIMLSDDQLNLADITTGRAVRRPVGETVTINGTLTTNKQNSQLVSSRAAGRLERLYIKETGRRVREGEPLYVLYSETLLTLQQEYLLAKDQFQLLGKEETRYKSFLDAAERKLRLYGLTSNQIANLTSRQAIPPRVTFLAPRSGIVTDIKASEGGYVVEGQAIYILEDISSLWVEAELFANEASQVKAGDKITVRITGFESTPMEATVTFLSPEYRANSQITIMRAELANPDLEFKPGQQVQISFINSSRDAIAVPVNALIRNEDGTHVYVGGGLNTFQPRMVVTGLEGDNFVEITEGLREGDTIVVTGAYLLYSEIVLKRGSDPMAGHKHQ